MTRRSTISGPSTSVLLSIFETADAGYLGRNLDSTVDRPTTQYCVSTDCAPKVRFIQFKLVF